MVSYKNETMKQTVFIQLLFYTYGLFSYNVNRIQDGLFQGCSRMRGGGGGFFAPPPGNLSHISYNDETWHGYRLPKEDSKNI